MYVHLQVRISGKQHTAQLARNLHAVHRERLVRPLGAHLERARQAQRHAQIFYGRFSDLVEVLCADGRAAECRDAENFGKPLLGRIHVNPFARLGIHGALRLIDLEFTQGLQPAAHRFEQNAFKRGTVQPLQRHFALIGKQYFLHAILPFL